MLPSAAACSLAILLAACGAGAAPASIPSPVSTSTGSAGSVASGSSDTPYACPSAQTSSGALDCTKLPLGDQKFSTTGARAGYVYACTALSGEPVVETAPWLNESAKTWNASEKLAVEGAVSWDGSFSQSVDATDTTRTIVANGEPTAPTTTGVFPIQPSDPAYQYDRNPNHIAAQNFDLALPANPTLAAAPSCLNQGAIGITLTGVAIYNGFDAAGYDAVAREIQDPCHGHPDQSSTYHYHGWLQACVTDAGSAMQNSSLLGYAADGFGIYGPWYDGKILTSADLDECHGTTSEVEWDGKLVNMYHYVSTYDFPYTLGCYRGTAVRI